MVRAPARLDRGAVSAVVILTAALSGCATGWPDGPWQEGGCPAAEEGSAPRLPQHFAARNDTTLSVFGRRGADYVLEHGMAIARGTPMATGDGRLFAVRADGALVAMDASLEVQHHLFVGSVGALAYANGILWAASRGFPGSEEVGPPVSGRGSVLLSFDSELRPLGRLELLIPVDGYGGLGKQVDDILLHEGLAYLVDDVAEPYWVFLADVGDPARPLLLANTTLSSVNGGPIGQWVDPRDGLWHILVGYFVRPGSGQSTHTLELPALERQGSVSLHFQPRDEGGPWGYQVKAVTGMLPGWAVLVQDDAELAWVDVRGGVPFAGCSESLDGEGRRAGLHVAGGLALVSWGSTATVFDVSEDPRKLTQAGLPYEARQVAWL